jgi:hypothetical protein
LQELDEPFFTFAGKSGTLLQLSQQNGKRFRT